VLSVDDGESFLMGKDETAPINEMNIVGGSGFEFEESVKYPDGSSKRKPGWVANNTGSFTDIKIDTSSGGKRVANASAEAVVAYLKSYEHMSRAQESCVGGGA
jgi:hypothetical protein